MKKNDRELKKGIVLQQFLFQGEQWGSNPRPSEPQSDALPTELCPPFL